MGVNVNYLLELCDADIVIAYTAVMDQIAHTDAPSEDDLVVIRRQLRCVDYSMLSTHWLRNKIVALRKSGELPSSKKKK